MKVAQYTDSYIPSVDGVSKVVQKYVRYLPENGVECLVFAPKFPNAAAGSACLIRSAAFAPGFQYRLALPFADRTLAEREEAFHPDVVHAHSPFAVGQRALHTARRFHVPLAASFHTDYRCDLSRALKNDALVRPALRRICAFYEQADEVWTMNGAAEQILRSYGYRGSVRLLPHGVERFSGGLQDEAAILAARRAFGIDGCRLTLLFVGQIVRQKNIEQILRALALLKDRLDFTMYFVGKGRDREAFVRLAESLSLGSSAVFTGYVSDELLHGMYALANLFVFPSYYDTAGLVVAEAAAAGVPSVVLRGTGAASGISDGTNGYLCENSAESIAEAILSAQADREVLKRCGIAARQTLVKSWVDVCGQAAAAYRVLSGAASRQRSRKS